MAKIKIIGPAILQGTISINGAKNAALPCMAASLLTDSPVILHNIPEVKDVETLSTLLRCNGADISFKEKETCQLHFKEIRSPEAPYELVKTMRASILILGPLLARNGYAKVSLPGGCAIGARPVEQHLKGLEKLGAEIILEHGYIIARAKHLMGSEFTFDKVTVTGTENIMMTACLARGETILNNCAREPEIENLAHLLIKMGAIIEGIGTDCLFIKGNTSLHGATHTIIPDRIETGTYAIAGIVSKGNITITNCNPEHLHILLQKLKQAGANISITQDTLLVSYQDELLPVDIETNPYPNFPTDLQAQFMALMTQANGTSLIKENIFENRFMHIGELRRMGADIQVNGSIAMVKGKTPLSDAHVMATDLRASACLVIAALVAKGETIIDRVYHLERGYTNLVSKLAALGASIEKIT
ncbi:MAG: UDP-N-acetylglucosamine 1-carboxyvinyltransferase [Candidatus Fischerbacteria bacterium RBG_13_37_8]|uniref:UDP-N-acetylglucosamine 1-carboxyvinyltransferase n=1 Tax=Candidatus Fischerbacteria bacterium RBG_13_37_8 TaxID=1817863 RepID=A0A1F5VNJ6_9BACT|nr:MAG: UDP-N-acetylglucosamine 1-carboxyvinyltransferase [Candidatus Fischerbacteria bacterium RBG_13_37_8]